MVIEIDTGYYREKGKAPLKISMWSDSYYPYISGVTRSIATLREALESMGHQVYLYCPRYPGAIIEDERVMRFPSLAAPTNKDYYIALTVIPGLTQKVRNMSYDVIHIHSPFNLGKKGLAIGRRLKIPVVLTYHTMYSMYAHYVPLFGSSVSRLIESMAINTAQYCDAVVTPTQTIKDYLVEKGLKAPCVALANGIDLAPFGNGDPLWAKKAFGIPQSVPLVVTSGRLGKEKNFEVLFESYAHSLRRIESFLLVVGSGPLRKPLEELASTLGAKKNIIFAGMVKPELMPNVYAAADLFLFTSLTDTQGLVIAEAKASGLPCIAVSAMGVKDMVKDGVDGYLCNNDPGEIGDRIAYLLTHEGQRKRMSENAKKTAQDFSSETQAKKMIDLYQSLLHR